MAATGEVTFSMVAISSERFGRNPGGTAELPSQHQPLCCFKSHPDLRSDGSRGQRRGMKIAMWVAFEPGSSDPAHFPKHLDQAVDECGRGFLKSNLVGHAAILHPGGLVTQHCTERSGMVHIM